MIYRCVKSFETRESGDAVQVEPDTVWYMRRQVIVRGGYECADLMRIEDGEYTADTVRVRLDRVRSNFDPVPLKDCVGITKPY